MPVICKQFEDDDEKFLDHRVLGQCKNKQKIEFLVLWKGKPKLDATWEKA